MTITSIPPTVSPTQTVIIPTATDVPVTPSPTPVPYAAIVNGEGIRLDEYLSELERYRRAIGESGTNLAMDEGQSQVLEELINQVLLAQAAKEKGFTVDEIIYQDRVDYLVAELGSEDALLAWQSSNGYTPEVFKLTLTRSIMAAWMRDQIASDIPDTVDQVHARQLFFHTKQAAQDAFQKLESGIPFLDLVRIQDPVAFGELGWFPRGYIFEPVLEDAAFSMEPGAYSEILETKLGFHILQVLEKNSSRILESDARLALQSKQVEQWLVQRNEDSKIEILNP